MLGTLPAAPTARLARKGPHVKLLHTKIWRPQLDPIRKRIEERGLPVELVPLGSGPGDALLVGWSMSDDELHEAEEAGVRWAQVLTVGLEDVITPAVAASPITITTVAGLATTAMAEFVFARILEHAKKLPHLDDLQSRHEWDQMQMLGSLRGATLTVVGLGPVGRRVAEVGRAFGMHLIGVRRHPEHGPGPCDEVVAATDLPDVLGRSDYVVVAAPQTPETVGLFDERALAAMREGSLLVNIGRGPLIDEQALVAALRSGRFRAALDVFDEEPIPEESPLWDTPGLRISPHCAAINPSLFDESADIAIDNIQRFLADEPLRNVVDKEAGYPVGEQRLPTP